MAEPPVLNTDLLYRTLDVVIDAEAVGRLNMNSWIGMPPALVEPMCRSACDQENLTKQRAADICETTACFAGWTLMQDGGHITAFGSIETCDGTRILDGDIEREAADRLGLTDRERDALFYAEDDITLIKAIVDAIAAGELR